MCLFGKNKNNNGNGSVEKTYVSSDDSSSNVKTFRFDSIPSNLYELQGLPEASLDDPYKTASLTLCALCVYGKDRENGKEMLNWLRGPQPPLSNMQIQFLNDRFMDGQFYVPYSYFKGATPDNDYTPDVPYTVTISANAYSFQNEGYATLHLTSGGADSPREIQLRRASGQWFLWEQRVLVGIRQPKSKNPWG